MPTREEKLQFKLASWMNATHPSVYYRSDLGGLRVPMGLAVKIKRIQKYRGHPDFTIFEQSAGCPLLTLELKVSESDIFLKRGGLINSNYGKTAIHLIEQAAMILMLRKLGYAADLVIGQEQAEWAIDRYLEGVISYTINIQRILNEASEKQIIDAAIGHPVVAEFVKVGYATGLRLG